MFDQMMGRFARVEPRRRAAALVLGLLSDLPRRASSSLSWVLASVSKPWALGGVDPQKRAAHTRVLGHAPRTVDPRRAVPTRPWSTGE